MRVALSFCLLDHGHLFSCHYFFPIIHHESERFLCSMTTDIGTDDGDSSNDHDFGTVDSSRVPNIWTFDSPNNDIQ